MQDALIKIIKNLKGNVLIVGIDSEKVLEEVNNNKKIKNCYLLKDTKIIKHKKVISDKELEKLLSKNKIYEIVCNYYTNKDVFKKIPSKFYLDGKLYLYGYMSKYEAEEIKEKYSYYTKNIDVITVMGETIMTIGSETKENKSDSFVLIDLIDAVIGIFTR